MIVLAHQQNNRAAATIDLALQERSLNLTFNVKLRCREHNQDEKNESIYKQVQTEVD